MGKVCKSPVKKWQGSITLCDPLSFPQVIAIEDAIAEAKEHGKGLTFARYHSILAKAAMGCVENWELEGLENPPVPFPATPRLDSGKLMEWIIGEIMVLYGEGLEVPES